MSPLRSLQCDEPTFIGVESLACPLTLKLFEDPVVDREGHTYERVAILKWLDSHSTSPMTRQNLRSTDLTPNRKVKELCALVISLLDEHRETKVQLLEAIAALEQSSAIACKEDPEVHETWREVCPEGSQ